MIRKEIMGKISGPAPIQPYTTEEIATMYGVHSSTLLRWFDEKFKEKLGMKRGLYYNIKQVKLIFEEYGRPELDEN
jgi:hypothetical protein